MAGMKATVRDVNNNSDVVEAEEVLSDSVYYYDRGKGEIRMAEEGDLLE